MPSVLPCPSRGLPSRFSRPLARGVPARRWPGPCSRCGLPPSRTHLRCCSRRRPHLPRDYCLPLPQAPPPRRALARRQAPPAVAVCCGRARSSSRRLLRPALRPLRGRVGRGRARPPRLQLRDWAAEGTRRGAVPSAAAAGEAKPGDGLRRARNADPRVRRLLQRRRRAGGNRRRSSPGSQGRLRRRGPLGRRGLPLSSRAGPYLRLRQPGRPSSWAGSSWPKRGREGRGWEEKEEQQHRGARPPGRSRAEGRVCRGGSGGGQTKTAAHRGPTAAGCPDEAG